MQRLPFVRLPIITGLRSVHSGLFFCLFVLRLQGVLLILRFFVLLINVCRYRGQSFLSPIDKFLNVNKNASTGYLCKAMEVRTL